MPQTVNIVLKCSACIRPVDVWFHLMHFFLSAEHQSSPVAEMGDTLEFSDIYQEVKGSWVSTLINHLSSLN